jgi:alpha-glucosidase
MSVATREAMLARRLGKRNLVITHSTFVGAGAHVGNWLGDNLRLSHDYRFSIAGMLVFASIYQVPMVGSDICGFGMFFLCVLYLKVIKRLLYSGGNTTENLSARWAMFGAFDHFMRNVNLFFSPAVNHVDAFL